MLWFCHLFLDFCASPISLSEGRIFLRKGTGVGEGGGKNRKTPNMQCLFTALRGSCVAQNLLQKYDEGQQEFLELKHLLQKQAQQLEAAVLKTE